jgi:hypothetical protein
MIWFRCSKCGKTHGRPENSVGTMIFCECGQGNTVPWESTAPEPPPQLQAPSAVPGMPHTPTLAPLTFDSPSSGPSSGPSPPPRIDEGRRRGRPMERRDPAFCLNHPSTIKATSCDDCGESFCASCVVSLEGATVCAPCKNFRVRGLELPPHNSTAATFSLLIALVTGGMLTFCLLPFANIAAISILALLTIVPQLLALALGIRAIYLAQQDGAGRLGGQAWAVTGVTTAALCITLTLLLSLYGLRA